MSTLSGASELVAIIVVLIILSLLLTLILVLYLRQRANNQDYVYISAEQVILINEHITQIQGLLRDLNALESALTRPHTAAYYEQADIVIQTAVLIEGIAMNHPFVDGNKRTAMLTGLNFLESNGYRLRQRASREIGQRIESLVVERNLEEFTEWLRSSIQKS